MRGLFLGFLCVLLVEEFRELDVVFFFEDCFFVVGFETDFESFVLYRVSPSISLKTRGFVLPKKKRCDFDFVSVYLT